MLTFVNYILVMVTGDRVAVFMENCAEYVPIWLGLTKIGCVPALINWNLKNEALSHCVKISEAKGIIFNSELRQCETKSRWYRYLHFLHKRVCTLHTSPNLTVEQLSCLQLL